MKRFLSFFIFLALFSCSGVADKPQNLIPKSKMAEMVAEFAIADQMTMLQQPGSPDKQAKFILQSRGVTAKDFSDSYKYYVSSPKDLEDIYNDAQDIIKERHPDAEKFIESKLKTNGTPQMPAK